jgi:hypothetical protein
MGQSKRQRRKRRQVVEAARRPGRQVAFTVPVTVQAADASQPAARRPFRMTAYTGEPMDIYPFDLPVVIDVASMDLAAQRIPALLDHMAYEGAIVGQIERVTTDGGRPPVVAEGYFTPTDDPKDAGAFVLKKADAGFQWQASVGGNPAVLEKIEAGKAVAANGRTYTGPLYLAREVKLREISFVVLGGDGRTSVAAAHRRIQGGAAVDFETWVASLGFVVADLTDQQRAALQIQFNQMYPDASDTDPATVEEPTNAADANADPNANQDADPNANDPPTNAAARRPAIRAGRPAPQRRQPATDAVSVENERIAANRQRIADIESVAAEFGVSEIELSANGRTQRVQLVAHAIRNNWDRNRTELEARRAQRGHGPAVITRGHERDATIEALSCAMILRAGGRLDDPAYQRPQAVGLIPAFLRMNVNAEARQRAMEAAHRYRQMSAVDLCREAIRLDGKDAPVDRDDMIRAAFSGGSLTNIFTTNVNAILLPTYLEAPDTTVGWVSETDVADYKSNERPAMTKGSDLTKQPRTAEADHHSRGDTMESYKVSRFSRQFVVDEMDAIDDNLGALQDEPKEMGLAAARVRPNLCYAILLANATLNSTGRALFNATDGNTATGAAFTGTTLKAAASAMRLVRENGVNLDLPPTHLILPPTLEFDGYTLINSTENILAGTAGSVTERGNINPIQRLGLTLVSDARLENGVTDPDSGTFYAGSSSNWYLASNLGRTIEVGYLRGTGRAPRTRTWKYDRDGKFGMGWDVSISIGAKALDWKGFQRRQA